MDYGRAALKTTQSYSKEKANEAHLTPSPPTL